MNGRQTRTGRPRSTHCRTCQCALTDETRSRYKPGQCHPCGVLADRHRVRKRHYPARNGFLPADLFYALVGDILARRISGRL